MIAADSPYGEAALSDTANRRGAHLLGVFLVIASALVFSLAERPPSASFAGGAIVLAAVLAHAGGDIAGTRPLRRRV